MEINAVYPHVSTEIACEIESNVKHSLLKKKRLGERNTWDIKIFVEYMSKISDYLICEELLKIKKKEVNVLI